MSYTKSSWYQEIVAEDDQGAEACLEGQRNVTRGEKEVVGKNKTKQDTTNQRES